MSKIVFLVFMCPGTLSLSTPVDADGSDLSQCCFLSCFVAFFFVFLFFSEIYPLKKCFVSYTLKYLLNLLAGQFCLCSLLKEDKTQKKKDLKSSD